jgi:hypothetical protein
MAGRCLQPLVEEHVGGLEVAVGDGVRVQEGHAQADVPHQAELPPLRQHGVHVPREPTVEPAHQRVGRGAGRVGSVERGVS